MTDGPAATVGEMTIPFERPRDRSIMKLLAYKVRRSRIIDFLEHHAKDRFLTSAIPADHCWRSSREKNHSFARSM